MEKIKSHCILLMASIDMIVTHYLGKMTPLLYSVVALMGIDLITRIYAASIQENERVESRKILQGLYRKLGLCLLIILSLILDSGMTLMADLLELPFSNKIIFTHLTLAWLFIRELISNLENLKDAGIELPEFIIRALRKTKEQVEQKGEEIKHTYL